MASDLTELPLSQKKENFFAKFFVPQEKFPARGIELKINIVEGDLTEYESVRKVIKAINKKIPASSRPTGISYQYVYGSSR